MHGVGNGNDVFPGTGALEKNLIEGVLLPGLPRLDMLNSKFGILKVNFSTNI